MCPRPRGRYSQGVQYRCVGAGGRARAGPSSLHAQCASHALRARAVHDESRSVELDGLMRGRPRGRPAAPARRAAAFVDFFSASID